MATEIGIIKTVIGTVTATAVNGSQRALHVGDKVFADDVISTGTSGAVEIEFADGSVMDFGRSSQAILDTEFFDPQQFIQTPTDIQDDVDALQQALLEGTDPEVSGEATAAGLTVESEGNDGISTVQVLHNEQRVTPTAGFSGANAVTLAVPTLAEVNAQNEVVNLPPVATAEIIGSDDVRVFEDDSIVTGTIAAIDPNGDPLTFTLLDSAPAGFIFNADGTYSFDPSHDAYQSLAQNQELAPIVLGVRVADPLGEFVDTTLTLNLTGTNDSPIVVAEIDVAVFEDAAAVRGQVIANDIDSDDDSSTLDYSLVGNIPAGLTFNENGSYEFDPSDVAYQYLASGETGDVTFSWKATDSHGADSATDSVTITVKGTNDGPVANLDGSTTLSVNTTGTGDALVYDSTGENSELLGGAISLDVSVTISTSSTNANSILSYAAPGSNNEFLIFANDTGTSIGVYIDGSVHNVNLGASIYDGTPHTISVSWDSNTGTSSLSIDGSQIGSSFTLAQGHTIGENGVLMLGQEQDSVGGNLDTNQIFSGDYHGLSITKDGTEVAHYEMDSLNGGVVADSVGGFDLSTVGSVSITTNTNPLVTDEDTALIIDPTNLLANDSDLDGDAISLQSVSNSQHGTVSIDTAGNVVFTPELNFSGEATFDYTITDGTLTDTATVTVNVNPINDAPVAVDDSILNNQGDVLVSEDFEAGAAGWSNTTTTNGGELTNFLGRFGQGLGETSKTFGFGAGHAGEEVTITFDMYEIDSWDGESFKVLINGTEESSVALRHSQLNGGSATQNNVFSAWSDEVHHYSITATLDSAGNVKLGFSSTLNQSINDESWGIDNLTILASDPNWSDETLSTNEDTSITLNLLANDYDVDSDSFSISTIDGQDISLGQTVTVTNGSVVLDGAGKAVFTPNANYYGPVSFTYTLNDGAAESNTATVTLNVLDINDAPVITVQNVTTTTNSGTELISEDFETGAVGWSNTTTTNGGELTDFLGRFGLGSGVISKTFSFGAGHAGEDVSIDFDMYEIDSWDGESFKVLINGTEDSSTALRHSQLDDGTATQNNVFSAWSDEVHHYSITATLDSAGNVELGFSSTLNQSINDESWGVDNLTISNVDDWVEVAVVEDIPQIIAIASDIDGTIVSSTLSADNGTVSIDADGNVMYLSDLNYNGTDVVRISVTDDDGAVTQQAINLNVSPVNDAPISESVTLDVTAGSAVNVGFGSHVSDIEDDSDTSKDTMVKITVLPVNGTLADSTGEAVAVGTKYDLSGLTYTANSDATGGILLGAKGTDTNLSQWGYKINNDKTSLVKVAGDITATTESSQGELKVYGGSANSTGYGIGDKDGQGINPGENITVTFAGGLITSAEIGFDGLGGYFLHSDTSQNAKAIWTAMNGNQVVASGEVQSDGDLLNVINIIVAEGFDSLVFDGTSGNNKGYSYEVRYIEAELTSTDSFVYKPVDSDGLVGNESTVSINITGNTDGNDQIFGRAGNDILIGGAGDDILTGGTGEDIFVWHQDDIGTTALPAHDTVTDFEGDVISDITTAHDVLDLSDLLSDPNSGIEGIEYDGHLQLKIGTIDGSGQVDSPVQTIDLSNITVGNDTLAGDMLDHLLANGGINDGH